MTMTAAVPRPLSVLEVVEVHESIVALLLGQQFDGRASRDDGLQVVPTTDDTFAMALNQLAKWDTHLFLDGNWVVDMS